MTLNADSTNIERPEVFSGINWHLDKSAEVNGSLATVAQSTVHTVEPTSVVSEEEDEASRKMPRRIVLLVFSLSLVIYAFFIPNILKYSSPPTGDQPFYLMDTISLVQDWDLNVRNNYDNRDEDKFYSLAPHPSDFVGMAAPYPLPRQLAISKARPAEEEYSFHPPGLGAALVPAWVVGGWFGLWWPAAVLFMCVIGALVAVNIFLLAFEVTGKQWIAWVVWAPLAFSSPIMSYSYLVFSELPTGLVLIYAFRRLALGWKANEAWRLALVGACIGYIPWLAIRCVPIATVLLGFAAVQFWRYRRGHPFDAGLIRSIYGPASSRLIRAHLKSFRTLLVMLAPVAVLGALLSAYHIFLFGSVMPEGNERYGSGVGVFHWPWVDAKELKLFLNGVFGLFVGQRFGLLTYTPIFVFAIAGYFGAFRIGGNGDRRLLGWITALALPYVGIIAAYDAWGGVWCPPGRYLSTLAPLLGAPIALSLLALSRSRVYRSLYAGAAVVGFGFMSIMVADPRLMFPSSKTPILDWLALSPQSPFKIDLREALPSFSWPNEVSHAFAAGWVVGAAVLLTFTFYLLVARQGNKLRMPRLAMAVQGTMWLGALCIVGAAWLVVNYEFLRPKTLLVEQARWKLPADIYDPGDIAYLDGKIYIPSFGRRTEAGLEAGEVGELDLESGIYRRIQPRLPNGKPLSWKNPGHVRFGEDGLLYVMNNGEDEEALLVMRLDGEVVRQMALVEKSPYGRGFAFGPLGNLYVADIDRGSVLKYSKEDMSLMNAWGGTDGILNNPASVTVRQDGSIYTTESYRRVQQFDKAGQFVRQYDLRCRPYYFAATPEDSEWIDVTCESGLVSINTQDGYVQMSKVEEGNPKLMRPLGATYGNDGTLYVLDDGADGGYIVAYRVTR